MGKDFDALERSYNDLRTEYSQMFVLLCRALNNKHTHKCEGLCCVRWRKEAQSFVDKKEPTK